MSLSKLVLKDNPSNLDLQQQNSELHDCMEQLAQSIQDDRDARASGDRALGRSLDDLRLVLQAVVKHVGAPDPLASRIPAYRRTPRRKTLAGWNRWAAMATVFGTVISALLAYRSIEPAFLAALTAFHRALIAAH